LRTSNLKDQPTATMSGARFVQPFEASRDIHTIAKNVIVVDDVVTLVDADGNSMRRLAETAVFLGSVAPAGPRPRSASRQ